MWKEVCGWRPVSGKWQGKLGFTKQWGKQSIPVPTQMGTPLFPPSSHFVSSFTVARPVHDGHMTKMLSVPALFPFCITYEFDLHSRAVLISQSSSNHCILLKKYAYYYPSSGCVMTGVLKVVKRFLVAYGVMCM